MAGPAVEAVNVADQIKSQLLWRINELGQEYDFSDWHLFIYGYPERAALEVRITAPDRVKTRRQFSEQRLTALVIRHFSRSAFICPNRTLRRCRRSAAARQFFRLSPVEGTSTTASLGC